MSEENKELEGNSQNPEGDKPKEPEYSDSERQLYARATKAEARLKELEAQKPNNEQKPADKEQEAKQYLKNLLKETLERI